MNYETVLLIGGPKDGERMSVIEGVRSIRFPVKEDIPVYIAVRSVRETTNVEFVEYRRVQMAGDRGFRGCVYVFDGVDPMSALIDGYRKP